MVRLAVDTYRLRAFAVLLLLCGMAGVRGQPGYLRAEESAVLGQQPALRAEQVLGTWKFQPGTQPSIAPDEAKWKKVALPYLWHRDVPDCDSGWLETEFTPQPAWRDKRISFDAMGLECDGILFVDGQKVAELHGPDAQADMTAQLTPGKSATLRLWVTRWWMGLSWSRTDDVIRSSVIAQRGAAMKSGGENAFRKRIPVGVSGRLRVCASPLSAAIEDVTIRTSVRQKQLQADFALKCASTLSGAKLLVQVCELDGTREGLPTAQLAIPAGQPQTVSVVMPWKEPKLWSPGAPHLYLLYAQITDAQGNVLDRLAPLRFGFREFRAVKNQLLLNEQPFHMRLAYSAPTKAAMQFFSGIGFNGVHLMPVPGRFFGDWGLFPGPSREELAGNGVWDHADEMGWAMYVYAPGVHYINQLLVENPKARAEYARYLELWLKRFGLKNHPSILAWSISMNNMGTADPRDFGRRRAGMPAWYAFCENLVKEQDSTRLVFHHQGGPNGDFQMQNLYLNFMALQEREEFPSLWSATGDMPAGCAEMGTPFTASFFRYGNTVQFTEYGAIYFGDAAYAKENDAYVRAGLKLHAVCPPAGLDDVHGDHYKDIDAAGYFHKEEMLPVMGEGSSFYDFMHLFNRNTNRAYRGFGLNAGWWPWMMDVGFGIPPEFRWGKKPGWMGFDYRELKEGDYRDRPAWANPLYDAFRATMQPALFYWGGRAPDFFTKEHTYYFGASAEKTIVAVWDGPDVLRCRAHWELRQGEMVVSNGEERFTLAPGAIEKRPVQFHLPQTASNGTLALTLTVTDDSGKVLATDNAALHLLPSPALSARGPASAVRRAVCDPYGGVSKWLRENNLPFREINAADALDDIDELIIGSRALDRLSGLPFTPDDVARGLRVLLLSCDLNSLEACGFRAQEAVARRAYIRVPGHPLLAGLQNVHLSDWHGAGTQLGRTSDQMRQWGWMHAPHWNNNGSVASVVIETPHKGAYTPLVDCEFDLSYTPLLEWRHGRGFVLFCQFDLFDRSGSAEPAAETIKAQALAALTAVPAGEQNKTIVYGGADAATKALLMDLGFRQQAGAGAGALDPAATISVIGAGELTGEPGKLAALREYVRQGGTVLTLPQQAQALQQAQWDDLPLQTQTRALARVVPDKEGMGLTRGIGPQLLHWRTFLDISVFTPQPQEKSGGMLEGLLHEVPEGKGRWVFCQLDWRQLPADNTNVRRTHWRMRQFYRQLCTNLGAQTDFSIALKQFSGAKRFAPQRTITNWLVCKEIARISPQQDTEGRGSLPALGQELPAEAALCKTPESAAASGAWEVREPQDGVIDFGRSNVGHGRVGMAAVWIYSSRPREAEMSIRGDWWLVVSVNGRRCLDNSAHSPAGGNANQILLPLQQGWNLLLVKLSSGGGGFNFQASISDPGDLHTVAAASAPELTPKIAGDAAILGERHNFADVVYLCPLRKIDDPYGWHPW